MTEDAAPVDHRIPYRLPSMTVAQRVKFGIKRAIGLHGVRRTKILAGPARGVTMTLDFYGHTPLYLGMYEWELHRFLAEAVRDARLAFDIGGYIGYDALMVAAHGVERVVTFEPDDARRPALADNVAQNPRLARAITISPVAIASRQGDGATTLDALADQFGMPDLIKIDIDGGEADALRGGRRVLESRHPDLIVETHSLELERECGSLLLEAGYRPTIKHNRGIWREQRAGAAHNRWLLAKGTRAGEDAR